MAHSANTTTVSCSSSAVATVLFKNLQKNLTPTALWLCFATIWNQRFKTLHIYSNNQNELLALITTISQMPIFRRKPSIKEVQVTKNQHSLHTAKQHFFHVTHRVHEACVTISVVDTTRQPYYHQYNDKGGGNRLQMHQT